MDIGCRAACALRKLCAYLCMRGGQQPNPTNRQLTQLHTMPLLSRLILVSLLVLPVACFTPVPAMTCGGGKTAFDDIRRRQAAQFDELRLRGSRRHVNVCDVYVSAHDDDAYYYVGKSCVAAGLGGADGPALSVVLQKELVLEHAKRLQPLAGAEQLEVWCAPPNSEAAIAQGADRLRSLSDAAAALALEDVGFQPEDGSGFHVRRRADGQFPLNCPWLCLVATGR